MKKIYTTTVVSHGPLCEAFIGEKMVVLFNENAPEELAEFCVLHKGNELSEQISTGDILRLNNIDYKIVAVGNEVQKNLRDLGHIALKFDNNVEGDILEGSLYLEDKELSLPAIGSPIEIYKL